MKAIVFSLTTKFINNQDLLNRNKELVKQKLKQRASYIDVTFKRHAKTVNLKHQ